jgi:uncharacterized protein (UPF0332 family)
MTDRETLFRYRLQEATDTLADAEQMLAGGVSPRSIVNRAYYSVFYFILALIQKDGINARTSKHSGVIGVFDKEYVLSGMVERRMGKIVHSLFDARQESDYKEMAEVTVDDAKEAVSNALEFAEVIKGLFLTAN